MAQLASLSVNDTGSLTLPSGTNANRPSLSSTVIVQWTNTGTQAVSVTSGSATTTSTSWTCPTGVTSIEVLVVAGGGAGGGYHGGGGGAGGVIYNSAFPVTPATSYTVTVGQGGTAATQSSNTGNAGSNSVFATLTAIGGGAGISQGQTAASRNNGGSGGGAADGGSWFIGGNGTPGQGHQGGAGVGGGNLTAIGYSTCGGGGAGGPGGGPESLYGGFGGPGVCYDISGTPTYYGGGGGGTQLATGVFSVVTATYGLGGVGGGGVGGYINQQSASPNVPVRNSASGVNGTGGGGGGFLYNNNGGGAGGSGIVIIRYALATSTTQPTGQTRFNTVSNTFENYETANKWKTAPVGTNIVTQGLTCHLDAARYGSSTAWTDISGFGNNGTLVGSPTYSSSNGGYFSFNGSSQYVTIGTSVGVSGNVEVSMSAWFYYTGGSTTGSTVMGFGGAGSAGDTFSIFLNNGGAYNIGVAYNGGQNLTSNNNVYQPNVWNHVTVTKIVGNVNATTTIYLNGNVLLQATAPSLTPSFVFNNGVIGSWVQSPGTQNFFTGYVSNVSVYSRALTQNEVKQNYLAHAGRFELTSPVESRQSYVTDRLVVDLDMSNPACNPISNPQLQIDVARLVDLASGSIGTLGNGALPVATPNYKFVRLDGTNDYISMSNPNVYLGTQHSYDAWIYVTGLKDATYARAYIFDLRGDGVDTGCSSYFLWDYSSAGVVNFTTGNGGVEVVVNGVAMAANAWHHLATTRDGNQWRIYLDGQLLTQGTSNLSALTLNNAYRIGMYSGWNFSSANYALPGYIGAARIYTKTLTSSEVMINYQAMKNRFGL